MATVIERLRASKQEADDRDKVEGREHGRTWAENVAEYRDLQRLARHWDDDDDLGPLETLIKAVNPNDAQWNALDYLFGDLNFEASDEYYLAFIKGAVEFFQEVRTQL